MRAAPIISLVLSILVGIAAVVFGRGWLNSEADATGGLAITVQEVETQKIYVADIYIERGDELSDVSFRKADWPIEHIPTGAIIDLDELVDDDGSFPFALGVMVPGEPVIAAKLSQIAVRDSLVSLIEPGFRAVSIEVDDATGVAGFVLPDHRVDVNLFIDDVERGTGKQIRVGRTLMSDIRVLAVDQVFADTLEGAALARTVTLQVTPEQGHDLGLAIEIGEIGLALRPEGEVDVVLPALAPPPPPAPRRVRRPTPAPVKKTTTIRVIQGAEEATVTTPVAAPRKTNEGQDK